MSLPSLVSRVNEQEEGTTYVIFVKVFVWLLLAILGVPKNGIWNPSIDCDAFAVVVSRPLGLFHP
jgi:hypothetical protein